MPLYRNDKSEVILFIHIPKTGGTSIEKSLSYYPEALFNKRKKEHVTPQHFDKKDYEYFSIPSVVDASFCIVREPFERIYSEYKYRMRKRKYLNRFLDFNSFVYYIKRIGVENSFFDNHIRAQSDFILDDTVIYKFESGVNLVIDSISKEFNFSKIECDVYEKKSREIKLNRFFDVEKIVYDLYKKDYDRFSYKPYFSKESLGVFSKTFSYLKSFLWCVFFSKK